MERTSKNIFITGRAGTGKSTLLQFFMSITKKSAVVLAPTGVAALNVNGQTIHSFFGFRPDVTVDTIKLLSNQKARAYKSIDMIIVDEVSMVRADLFDCMDRFMRLNGGNDSLPFGGAQMVFIGDLYQLPPVVSESERKMFKEHYKSEYFFDSHAFKNFKAEFVELEKNYRQADLKFIEILNAVRNNTVTEEQLKMINKRVETSFKNSDGYITLVPTNKLAEEINNSNLRSLYGRERVYNATVEGDFDKNAIPVKEKLALKPGAQVMLLNNDKQGRWVNGSVGIVNSIKHGLDDDDFIMVKLNDGKEVEVKPFDWELFKFSYDPGKQKLVPEVVGRFIQYPMMLAWAVTIHKSQGKTFDRMIIDVGSGMFANGQLYVALSRCRTIKGIVLRKKLEKKHVFSDWRVVKFLTRYQYSKSNERMSVEEKTDLISKAIKEEKKIEMVYLKSNDEKSRRVVTPSNVGMLEYLGKSYLGVRGFDSKQGDYRNFRVDRILEIKIV
jgi:ATP-dependent exoDNAse (exonuclease V) alpha subunit